MTRGHRQRPVVDLPDTVRDEVLLPARGETIYELTLPDEEVELLARGFCSESVARRAFQMLEWKRRHARKAAQDADMEMGRV